MDKSKVDQIVSANHPYARGTEFSPIVRIYPKVPRNMLCPFTRKKFKKCCGQTGQDFCEKARDSLKEHLMSMIPNEKNEEQTTDKKTTEEEKA